MRKSVFFVLCGLFVGLAGSPAFAGAHMGRGHGGGRWQGGGFDLLSPGILQKLNLTSDQQTQVQTIQAAHQNTEQALFAQLKIIHNDTTTKFYAPGSLTAADFSSSLQSVSQVQSQITNDRLAEALEVRAVLTPTQLATAAQFITRLQAMHAEMQDLSAEH